MSKIFLHLSKLAFFVTFLGLCVISSDSCRGSNEKEKQELTTLRARLKKCEKHPTSAEAFAKSTCNRCASNVKLLTRIQELECKLGIDEKRARRFQREFLDEINAQRQINGTKSDTVG